MRTDILKTPLFQEYEQLYSKYPKTLTCPCKTILINYTDILHINYTLHQVCTSIFITKDWISYLTYTGEFNTIYGDDFRSNGRFTFQALAAFCKLANRTVSDSLAEFLLNMYISATVTPLELFQSQILTFIDQFNSSITNNFLRTLDLVRSTTHTNALFSALRTNYVPYLPSPCYAIYSKSSMYSDCYCYFSDKCVIPSSIKNSNSTPLFVVPGLYDGCYIVEALLQSTLECFYSQTCITQLQSYYNSNSTMNTRPLDISSKSKYSVHSTVQHLLNQLMIEEWNANDKYENYYNKCQPIECSYSYKTRNGIVYIITALLGLVGGLITVLKIVVPNLVKFIRRKKQPETSRNNTPISEKIFSLIQKLKRFPKSLNLFQSIPPSTDEHDLRTQILSTRLFIFLLTLCLIILLVYNSLISVIRTDILKTPSYQKYEELYSKYPKTLTCPCKTIRINYTDILHINYTLHQVCTSIFVTKDWIDYLTYTGEFNTIYGDDFRSNGRFTFQALAAFCELANRTVSNSLAEFLLNMYISATVTPLELFQSQILTFIDQFNSSITNNFLRSFDLVLSTTHTNAFYSGVGSQSAKCSRPFSIKYTDGTPLFVVPGLFDGCYIVKALLQSTLECFYSQTCIIQLQSHYNYNSTMNIKSLNASSKTKYSVHSTVQHLLNQLMIEEWNANDKYENYYNKCQPIECSYSYETRNGIVYIITALLGLVGGLITVLKIVVPNLVKFIRRKKQPETPRNDILKTPSFQEYEQLYSKYPKTLTCPCKTIRINYTDILHINYTLHQVCTSIFVTEDWFRYVAFRDLQNSHLTHKNFQYSAESIFRELSAFCELANRTVSNSLAEFLLNMYISTAVTPLELFQSQVLTFIDQFNSSITNNFLRSFDLIRSTTHTNALFSALRTNYNFHVLNDTKELYLRPLNYSDCDCSVSPTCVEQISIFHDRSETILLNISGLYTGCYMVEALLQSTLEFFYSQTCISQLGQHFRPFPTMNIRPLNASSKTKYSVNSTVQHLLNQLMIEEWNANDKYEYYYNKCQPIECSYSYETRNGIVYIITALLGLVGGLITVLKIVVPRMVKFIAWIIEKRRRRIVATITITDT
ncbi:unnamed protein product [Adineta steineri]|uniref:Uncharacterized protein n=1 Tax=Adineta steineri TaxID=433720 RepID=A0A818XK56_9BILA|nr:unnamed protein product [Adineta steineri]